MRRRYLRTRTNPATATATAPVSAADKAPAQFDSWGAFLEQCAAPSEMESYSRASRIYPESFSETASYEAATDLAVNGWPEGTEKAAKLAYPIIDKLAAQLQREEFNYSNTGITFDVARVLEGEPECWIECEQVVVDAPGRVLRLVFNAAVSAGISTDTIMAKGAVTGALVSLLERAGFRVQVDCVIAIRSAMTHETWVPVKAAGQDLDLSRLIFALAHPAMLRRMWFSAAENFNATRRAALAIGINYGYPTECATANQGDIYIGSSYLGQPAWHDADSATNWIIAQLEAQGVKVTPEAQ